MLDFKKVVEVVVEAVVRIEVRILGTSNTDNRGRVGGGYMPAGLELLLSLPSSTKNDFY